MHLRIERVHARGEAPDAVEVAWAQGGEVVRWSLANTGVAAVAVDSVALVARLEGAVEPLQVLCHGYQSWSPTRVRTFRVDQDPSRADGVPALVLGMYHADPAVAEPDELRSELVTVLRDATGRMLVVGFLGASEHDGTIRVRPARDGSDVIEVWLEAHLGGAQLPVGDERLLHEVWIAEAEADFAPLLDAWAGRVGQAAGARVAAPYQVGWCSWYHYFHDVSEAALRANLAEAGRWPFEVFQLDDGYQPAIGDWLRTNDRFPTPLDGIAAAIAAEGCTPGIWLAPFLAAPESEVAQAHPGWFAHRGSHRLAGMLNDGWGGWVHVLDTTHPEVQAHLEAVAAELVGLGYPYLKLDFTYAPSLPGTYHDPTQTPAQRVRAGFEAIRRGAGDDAFLLGCGAPLGPTIGLVDGMRIGPDVAPRWAPSPDAWAPPGHEGVMPATVNAWRNTLARSFMHRRLWLNDPDCLMLRTAHTELTAEEARAWAMAVAASGGMALVSDDLSLLDDDARALLDEVLAIGRAVDADAAADGPPRCPDLLDADPPTRLVTAAHELVGDPAAGLAHLQGRLA